MSHKIIIKKIQEIFSSILYDFRYFYLFTFNLRILEREDYHIIIIY